VAASPVNWTAEEFGRMRALDRSLFVSAVFHLGHAARLGDTGALTSMIRALPVSQADDWSLYVPASQSDETSVLPNKDNITLADAYGLALVKHLPAMAQDVHQTMRRLFSNSHGQLEFTAPPGSPGYRANNPMVRLSVYAMYAHHPEKDLTAFLKPWSKSIKPDDESTVCIDMRSDSYKAMAGSMFSENMTLHAHAVMAENPQAIHSLGNCLDHVPAAIFENFSKRAKSYQWTTSVNSLEIAAKGMCPAVVEAMLEQLKQGCDRGMFLEWASAALKTHIENSGLTNTKTPNGWDSIQWHEACTPVFDAIMKVGGREFLSEHADQIDAMVTHSNRTANTEQRQLAASARKDILRGESIAQEAIKKAHPEAISACMSIIDRAKHFADVKDNPLDHPLLHLGLNNVNKDKITRQVADRVMAGFDLEFLKEQIARDGLTLLHASAKAGNISLCTALIDLGVDPLQKDERGWNAESHFKGDEKLQWRSYLSSRQAMAAVQSIFETLPTSGSHP
jgi:hypothetical protein